MHILIVVLHRPIEPTGVCRYAANLARCLADSAIVTQVTVVTGAWQRDYFETAFALSSEKIKFVSVDIRNSSISRNLWFLFGLPKLVKQVSPTIVHLSFPLPFVRSLFPCPVVATIHDLYPYQFPENFGYRQVLFNRLFLEQCIRGSDGLACVSKTTLGYLNQYFPQQISQGKNTSVIYNFVDFKQTYANQPADLSSKFNVPFILCVAQHRKNKNLDLLIKAYDSLVHEHQLDMETQLILVGSSGPETEYLTRLIQELALENSVQMLSAISDEELCWFYQNCKLFAIASSLEGFCIPLIEALYFSCKVICSDIPVLREIGSSNCTYFNLSEDPVKNLVESMNQALVSGASGKADIQLRFSKAAIADQLLQFYSELI